MIDLSSALSLYLVVDPAQCRGDVIDVTRAALRGGVTMVQLRAKKLTDRELLASAIALRQLCTEFHFPLLVNDRVDIALAAGADGVHLGVDDLPIAHARRLGGDDFIIGYSPETDEQLESAASNGANYLGIGPVYVTGSKADAGDALGIPEFARRMKLGNLPAVGIGGITAANAAAVRAAGADGIAVISAILGSDDPEQASAQLSRNS